MPRTTIDIDAPILRELKRLQKRRRGSLGRLVSELLADALARQRGESAAPFEWTTRAMGAHFDLSDKERVWSALDRRSDPE
jgi:hypothetical protein